MTKYINNKARQGMADTRKIREKIAEAEKLLDAVLSLADECYMDRRRIITESKKAIARIIEGDVDAAARIIEEMRGYKRAPSVIVDTGKQEFVEVMVLYHILKKKEFPGMEEMDVTPGEYLMGIADAIGELKRLIIMHIVRGEKEKAVELAFIATEIYNQLRPLSIKFANIIPGFRPKMDAMSSIISHIEDLIAYISAERKD